MKSELGADWRDKLASFDEKPFAAASIGQVHWGTLHDGRDVAMKIQVGGMAHLIIRDAIFQDFLIFTHLNCQKKSIISIKNWKDLASYCGFDDEDVVSALN